MSKRMPISAVKQVKAVLCRHPKGKRENWETLEWCKRCGAIRAKLGYMAAAERKRNWDFWRLPEKMVT